jgi:hypothetical protein
MNYRKICADGGTRKCVCPEALQLRMVPIAFCLPAQHGPRQKRFSPQRDQPQRIKVLRMDGPESHVTPRFLTTKMGAGFQPNSKADYPNHPSLAHRDKLTIVHT